MHTNDVVAERVLEREFSGALPLSELLQKIFEEKCSHTGGPEILLREVESRPEIFRVLHPCTGPWRCGGSRSPTVLSADPWVLLRTTATTLEGSRTERLIAETLRRVGHVVDAHSFTALARWLQLVMEAGEVRRTIHSAAMNHPVRQPSSVSSSTSVNPAIAVAA